MRYTTPFEIRVPNNPRSSEALALAYGILEQQDRVDESLESFTEKLKAKKDLKIVFGFWTEGVSGKAQIQQGAKISGEKPKAVSVLVGYECHDGFGLRGELDGGSSDDEGWTNVTKPFYLICRTLEGHQGKGIVSTLVNYVDRRLSDYTHMCASENLGVSTAKVFTKLGFEDFERSSFQPLVQSVDSLVEEISGLEDTSDRISFTEERVRWIRRRLVA
ncbi:hypothetical protein HOC80_00490 [archaeon]|jgi:hypothetical protein|nr:hypothetical protein [archaeon]MBT4416563.1 hypothetical protein [archaeon]